MKNQNNKKTVGLFTAILLVLFAGFFAFLIILTYLQNNKPLVYDKYCTPLIIGLVLDAIAMLAIIFGFGSKALTAEILMKRDKLLKNATPFIQSQLPRVGYDTLVRLVKSNLESDGFQLIEKVDLHPGVEASLAYRKKFSIAYDHICEYIFLLYAESNIAGEIDLSKAAEIIGKTQKKRFMSSQTEFIAFVLFSETVEPEPAKDVLEFYSEELLYILAAYDLQTGKVYFMNARKNRFSRFARVQRLIYKYIIGNNEISHKG